MHMGRLVYLLSLSALLGLFAADAGAQDNELKPQVYGRLNVSEVLNKPESGGHDPEFVSNASRLGIAGSLPVADSLRFIYQAEYEIDLDHGRFGSGLTSQRNTYLGLSGGFGTLLAGKYDTPTKLIQNRVDLFNDLRGDIRALVVAENRPNDTLYYASTEFGGFEVAFSAIVDGQSGIYDRLTRSTSTSISFTGGSWFAAVAVDNNVNGNDVLRLVSQYSVGDLQLGALYERSGHATNNRGEQDGFVLSAAYTLDKWVLKAQGGASDQRVEGGREYSLGADYLINDDSRLFGFVTVSRSNVTANNNDQYGLGYEYRF